VDNIIARDTIYAVRPDGERITIELSVGAPYQVTDGSGHEWACPVSLTPLYSRLHDAHGSTSLQALCLALSLAIDLLAKFREDGGTLAHDDGTEYTLDPLAFGAAVQRGAA
jgi:hypothetical protein